MGLKKQRVRIHLKSGETFDGLLIRRKPDFVIDVAELVTGEGEKDKESLEGKVSFLRENVRFWQVIR
jgi:hypothetical protein